MGEGKAPQVCGKPAAGHFAPSRIHESNQVSFHLWRWPFKSLLRHKLHVLAPHRYWFSSCVRLDAEGNLQEMPPLSLKRSCPDEFRPQKDGRSFVEYTLLIVLLALFFWAAMMYASLGNAFDVGWRKIAACIGNVVSSSSPS
jgi:Flp pilus assembly pilin Flp